MGEWISVDERLPDAAPVLVCFLEPFFGEFSPEVGVGYYEYPGECGDDSGGGWKFWLSGKRILGGGVTHWMPLPEPPKDGD